MKKKRIAVIAAAAAIAVAATTAYASGALSPDGLVGSLLIKIQDGVTSYSEDDGATWQDGLPEDTLHFTDDNGRSLTLNGRGPWALQLPEGFEMLEDWDFNYHIPFKPHEMPEDWEWENESRLPFKGFAFPDDWEFPELQIPEDFDWENMMPIPFGGFRMYNPFDAIEGFEGIGGFEWPEGFGFDLFEGFDGTLPEIGTWGRMPHLGGMFGGAGTMLMIRNIDGEISYSTDGGQTWTLGAPDGFVTGGNESNDLSSYKTNGMSL